MIKTVSRIIGYVLAFVLVVVGILLSILQVNKLWLIAVWVGIALFFFCLFFFNKWKGLNIGKKVMRGVCIALAAIITVGGIFITSLHLNTNNGKGVPVADYDKRIEIWGDTVAGNSTKSKLDDMNIKKRNLMIATIGFVMGIRGEKYNEKAEQIIDSFTYAHEIQGGYEKETYEDAPYIIPYIKEGSDTAVIVIPGGGYAYKSMDGATNETKDIALALNERGISAFVLHYRSNPYQFPIPQLDVQRAVRYLKAHATEYGITPQKIGLIGFSAGGYQVGSFINLFQGKDNFPADYVKDSVDEIDDSVFAAGMIYPALTFNYNVPMLFSCFDDEIVKDKTQREKLLADYHLAAHINTNAPRQFVCYGTNDGMVGMDGAKEYIQAAKTAGIDIKDTVAQGQDHTFAMKYYIDDYTEWLKATN